MRLAAVLRPPPAPLFPPDPALAADQTDWGVDRARRDACSADEPAGRRRANEGMTGRAPNASAPDPPAPHLARVTKRAQRARAARDSPRPPGERPRRGGRRS